jgi:hypothetical protein
MTHRLMTIEAARPFTDRDGQLAQATSAGGNEAHPFPPSH